MMPIEDLRRHNITHDIDKSDIGKASHAIPIKIKDIESAAMTLKQANNF